MSFENKSFLFYSLILFFTIVVITFIYEKKFANWVFKNWYKKRTFISYLSTFFYLLSFLLLSASLLDFRGKPEKIKSDMSKTKTLILIDTSESMLAEDIRPNRISKAIIIAKHFAKKAIGHEIGVIVFSDVSKKLIPFTTDTDLIESRLDTLLNAHSIKGGTSLSLALMEAVNYFTEKEGYADGNILLITDAEETDGGIDIEIPDKISLGVVGIGTLNGGQIPVRSQYGQSSFKTFQGSAVETKLDENFLKKIGSKVKHYKYWVASSYTLPTEDILNFLSQTQKAKKIKGDATVKKVLGHYIVIAGMISLLFALILKNFRWFRPALILLLCWIGSGKSDEGAEKKQSVGEKFSKELKMLKKAELNESERLKLYEKMLREGYEKEAASGYKENLEIGELTPEAQVNYGTSLIKSGDLQNGLKQYQIAKNKLNQKKIKDEKLDEVIKKNTLWAYGQDKKNKEKQKQQNKDKNKENEEDKKKDKEQNKDQEGEGEKKDPNQKNKKESDNKDNKEGKKSEKDKQEKKENSNDKKESENKQKLENKGGPPKGAKRKLPAVLKQLMSTDRELQMKLLDTTTKDRSSGAKRDW